jgi:hypothetical protein
VDLEVEVFDADDRSEALGESLDGDDGHSLLLCPRPACSSRPITWALSTARRYEAGSPPSSAAG